MDLRGLVVAVAVVPIAPIQAHAEGDRRDQTFLDLPFTIGGTTREGGRVVWGLRPEYLHAFGRPGIAVGPYLELSRSSGDTLLGTGATVTYFTESEWNLSPSVGVYHRWLDEPESGVAVGLFVGRRGFDTFRTFDLPVGVRFDYHHDGGARHELTVSFEIDTLWGLLGIAVASLAH